jgi:hypothetical protein
MNNVITAPPAFNFQYRGTIAKFSAVDGVQLRSRASCVKEEKNDIRHCFTS